MEADEKKELLNSVISVAPSVVKAFMSTMYEGARLAGREVQANVEDASLLCGQFDRFVY